MRNNKATQRRSKNGRRLGRTVGTVYLVHASRALHGARHYLGFSQDVRARVERHKAGRGNPMLGEMARRGIGWRVVRMWHGKTGHFEQELKRKGAPADFCPVCSKGAR